MKKLFSFLAILLFISTVLVPAQTSPKDFLGHEVGADRKLADYDQIMSYFKKLDEESAKIKVLTIGETVRKKPMIMAVITDEENMAQLDKYQAIVRRLRDAVSLTPEQAKQLAAEGKAIVLITNNQHATEIAASQMAMELAYDLVTGNTPYDSDRILKDVIVLLAPTINPDGLQMVTEWYRKYVGTKYEGGRMPWLYHDYAGHDNNRDWFMFNLPETRAVTKVLYHDWIPQVHIDEHQMGSTGARLFIPPFMDPPIPNVHPLVWRGVALFGTNMAYDLQQNNYTGIVYDRSFTAWWIGACDDTSWLHNSIGILSEMASVNIASPIFIDPTELPDDYIEKRVNFPDPWPGGWWRLRDLVNYELVLSKSLIKTAAFHKTDILYNFYKMGMDNIQAGLKGEPFAFVIPSKQNDMPTTLRMLEILQIGGVEIHQAKEQFIADGKVYPADSFIVYMSQPYRPYAQALLEKQTYPDMREYEGGPPIPPYDNAGWTLPLQMGVQCERIEKPFLTQSVKVDAIPVPQYAAPSGDPAYILLDSRVNASYSAVFALLKNKAEVFRTKATLKTDSIDAAAGSFIIKYTSKVEDALPGLMTKLHIQPFELDDVSAIDKAPLKYPRIALYQSWRSNMDEGWTRYMFDDLGVPYTTIWNKDFKVEKGKKLDLSSRFDVIVFASENADIIKTGSPAANSSSARRFSGSMPPEYEGGIDKDGVDALKAFVEGGGMLVTLNDACGLVFKEFTPPVSNALERVSRNDFFCPTSILKVDVKTDTPIGYGFDKEAAVMFSRSLALSTRVPSGDWERTVVASFPKNDVLLSGWLLGEDTIARKAAVVDTRYQKGHIVLIGIRCQHRAQSHGSYKFLLNALLYPEI